MSNDGELMVATTTKRKPGRPKKATLDYAREQLDKLLLHAYEGVNELVGQAQKIQGLYEALLDATDVELKVRKAVEEERKRFDGEIAKLKSEHQNRVYVLEREVQTLKEKHTLELAHANELLGENDSQLDFWRRRSLRQDDEQREILLRVIAQNDGATLSFPLGDDEGEGDGPEDAA